MQLTNRILLGSQSQWRAPNYPEQLGDIQQGLEFHLNLNICSSSGTLQDHQMDGIYSSMVQQDQSIEDI